MRKLAMLIVIFASVAACGGEVATTEVTVLTDEQSAPTPVAATEAARAADAQATATSVVGQPDDIVIEEQRVKDIEFRLSELERLLSAGDGMFSLEDDLANADGRLRAQQSCINALVLIAGNHGHRSDAGGGITGQGQFATSELLDLDSTSHARLLTVECGPSIDESQLAQLAASYGIEMSN